MDECRELELRLSRNIKPTLAHECVSSMLVSRAMISPSPIKDRYAKWNESFWFHISAPDPLTMKLGDAKSTLPARSTLPTSELSHDGGSGAAAGGDMLREPVGFEVATVNEATPPVKLVTQKHRRIRSLRPEALRKQNPAI